MAGARSTRTSPPEVFRPQAWLRGLVHFGLLAWVGLALAMAVTTGLTRDAVTGITFFVALFGGIEALHAATWIEVDGETLRVGAAGPARAIAFDDVLRVDVAHGLLSTSYTVVSRRGLATFTSFIGGHGRLCALIVERARLLERAA